MGGGRRVGAGVVQREKGWTGVEAGAGPRAEEHRGLQKPGKARARILPSGLWGTQPADTSISALRDPFRASAVQNAEGISLCCLQPLGWGNWSERRQEAHGGGRRAVPPSLGLEVPGAVSSSSSGLRRSPPGLHRAGRSEPPTLLTCQPLSWAPGRQTDTQAPERRWRWPPPGHTSHLPPGPKDPPTPLPGGLSTA